MWVDQQGTVDLEGGGEYVVGNTVDLCEPVQPTLPFIISNLGIMKGGRVRVHATYTGLHTHQQFQV